MRLNKQSQFDSPFDNYKERAKNKQRENLQNGEKGFDLRSDFAVFFICQIIACSCEYCFTDKVVYSFLFLLVSYILYFFVLRLFCYGKRRFFNVIINFFSNYGIYLLINHFFQFHNMSTCVITILIMSFGFCYLGNTKGEEEFNVNQYLILTAIAVVITFLNSLLMNFIGNEYVFFNIMLSAIELVIASKVLSVALKKEILFSGDDFDKITNIPQNAKKDFQWFCLGRVISITTFFVIITIVFGTLKVVSFGQYTSRIIELLIGILFLCYWCFVCFLLSKNKSLTNLFALGLAQYECLGFTIMTEILASFLMERSPMDMSNVKTIMSIVFFTCVSDIILVGFVSSYKRRLIFADFNKNVKGVPFILLLISMIIMLYDKFLVVY